MTTESTKPPVWFWIVGVISLLWNGAGIMNYLAQAYMTPEKLAELPAAEQVMYPDTPAWATAAFALAVFGGTIGSIFLLIRKRFAYQAFIVSLAGILVQMTYGFFMMENLDGFGPGGVLMPILIILVGVGLLYVAKKGIANGWLK